MLYFYAVFIQIFSHSSYWQEKCWLNWGMRSFCRKCQVLRCEHVRSYAKYSIDDLFAYCIGLKTFAYESSRLSLRCTIVVREILLNHGSLTGHFGILPNILCQTNKILFAWLNFFAKHLGQFLSLDILSNKNFPHLSDSLKFSSDMTGKSGRYCVHWT